MAGLKIWWVFLFHCGIILLRPNSTQSICLQGLQNPRAKWISDKNKTLPQSHSMLSVKKAFHNPRFEVYLRPQCSEPLILRIIYCRSSWVWKPTKAIVPLRSTFVLLLQQVWRKGTERAIWLPPCAFQQSEFWWYYASQTCIQAMLGS